MRTKDIHSFQKTVWDFYKKNKRDLPWRPKKIHKVTPYEILVSEYMLQQTQVDRVIPKYLAFIKKFPDFKTLACTQERSVLELWSGLGYNRRALYLKKAAEIIYKEHKGIIPPDKEVLKSFPGMGNYMASVLPVFVYGIRELLIETNIRTVYIYHFFKNKDQISDRDIVELLEKTLLDKNYRDWYYALMDYGSYLKKEKKIKNTQSKSYNKQKPFKGSLRYVRGTLLKKVLEGKLKKKDVYSLFTNYTEKNVDRVCIQLIQENLLKEDKSYFYI